MPVIEALRYRLRAAEPFQIVLTPQQVRQAERRLLGCGGPCERPLARVRVLGGSLVGTAIGLG
jgi:hypothetical protein